MLRDKAAINLLPSVADDDLSEEFGEDSNDDDDLSLEDDMNLGGDEGPSSSKNIASLGFEQGKQPSYIQHIFSETNSTNLIGHSSYSWS